MERVSDERWRGLAVASWALVGLGIVLVAFGWLLGRISGALTPFVIAFILVLVLRGPVNKLQSAGIGRGLSVLVCYLLGAALLTVLGLLIVPPLARQLTEFARDAPTYYDQIQGFINSAFYEYRSMRIPGGLEVFTDRATAAIGSRLVVWSQALTKGVLAAGGGAVGFVIDIVLSLVIGFFLLRDLPVMREELFRMAGRGRRAEAQTIYVKVITVLGGYLRGQLIIAIVVGVLTTIGLALAGVPYALVIGLVTGVFNIVPYFGPIVGAVLATLAVAFKVAAGAASPWLFLIALAIVFGVQQLESTFLSPRIMSEQVDLHPVLVIFSLLVGGTLFGFVGLLMAIPLAAVAKGLFVYYYEKATSETLATADGAIFRHAKKSRLGGRTGGTAAEDECSCESGEAENPSGEESE